MKLFGLCILLIILTSCDMSQNHPVLGGGYGIGEVDQGNKQGKWTFYRVDDTKESEGNFKNDEAIGEWRRWYANGNLQETSNWTNDIVHGDFINYHENGNVDSQGKYDMDKFDGPWMWHRDDGSKEKSGSFRQGYQQGEWSLKLKKKQLKEKRIKKN